LSGSTSYGASGFLIKNIGLSELEEKLVNLLTKAEYPISDKVVKHLMQYFQPTDRIKSAQLSVQEFKITRMLADGMSYQSIADLVSLSINGVRFYVKKIYRKLNITNRQELKMLFSDDVRKK
jgi:DNA-binding NarL/FixJ family response regulator